MSDTLIAYFSRADENYFGGAIRYVKKGNTEIPFVPFLMLGYLGKLFLWR